MSWAEVKKINSDLSTPLNEFIENKMRYVSSDNTLHVITNGFVVDMGNEDTLFTKIMKHPGVLRLDIRKDTDFSLDVYIYKNDEKIITKTLSSSGSYYTENFEFEKGDNIRITAYSRYSNGQITYMGLCGMVAFGDF